MSHWDGLTPPYSTIVADPPWSYAEGFPASGWWGGERKRPYSMMTLDEIAALPVGDLAAHDAHLYLWTTNRYLRDAFDVAEQWGFRFSQCLVWAKPPMGIGPGGAFSNTTEFVLFCRRGKLKPTKRIETSWWEWARHVPGAHHPTGSKGSRSAKPAAFFDVVEAVSPSPRLELFARQQRLGWDHWGYGHEGAA